jgi:CheY-like chemotaxis protein
MERTAGELDHAYPSAVSVFCADDHAGFRDALRALIAATPGFVHIGDACTGDDAIVQVPLLRPDLVLMDVHMPGMSGLVAAEILARDRPDLVIVLMAANPFPLRRDVADRCGQIVPKHELSPRLLRDLWHRRRTRARRGDEEVSA